MQKLVIKPGTKFNFTGKTEEQINQEISAGLQALREKQEEK